MSLIKKYKEAGDSGTLDRQEETVCVYKETNAFLLLLRDIVTLHHMAEVGTSATSSLE